MVLDATGGRVAVIDIGWVLTPKRLSTKNRMLDPELQNVDLIPMKETPINDLTDAVSLYLVDYNRNAHKEWLGVMPSTCYAADVDQRIKTAGRVAGYEAVAIPEAQLADEQCHTKKTRRY